MLLLRLFSCVIVGGRAERRGPGSAWAAAFERARVRVAEAVRREYDGAELFLG